MGTLVEFDYEAQQPDELTLRKGEIIKNVVIRVDGWFEGTLDGKKGLFRDYFVKVLDEPTEINYNCRLAKVLYSYPAQQDNELSLLIGDIVELIEIADEGWWRGKLKGKEGLVPASFLKEIDEAKAPVEREKINSSESGDRHHVPQAQGSEQSADAMGLLAQLLSTPVSKLRRYLSHATFVHKRDESYQPIMDYINDSQEHNFGIYVMNIIQIQRVQEIFTSSVVFRDVRRMMLWHGTTAEKVISIILEKGFELPSSTKTGLLQGRGIYFADRASKSAQYCHKGRTPGETGFLFLCNVHLGKSQYMEEPNHDLTRPGRGYNSVICKGRKIPCPCKYKRINGTIFPFGISIENPDYPDYIVEYNEYVVYNPEQIEIKFLIHFTFTDKKFEN